MRPERVGAASGLAARAGATVVALAMVAIALGVSPAAAQPTSSPGAESPGAEQESAIEVPEPVPGEEVCTIADYRLQELSGLVVLDDTFVAINNGGQVWEAKPIFFLNQACEVADEVRYPGEGERDPEALAVDRDAGILWVGDIGDNPASGTAPGEPRPTVALWRVDLRGDRVPVIHRLAYPDGPHDAEALILDGDGIPIIVTREPGTAGLYRPAEPMVPNNPHEQAVPLERVGEFAIPDTGAEHPQLGMLGRQVITAGANSPDGDRVALRTYTDAFEFDVADGDVVGAITGGTPRVTPLAGEPWGESLSYSPDGAHFLTVSETAQAEGVDPVILRYTPTEPAPEPPPAEEPGQAAPAGRSLLDRLGPQGILWVIAGFGLLGLLMVSAGGYGIVRSRRGSVGGSADGDGGPDDDGRGLDAVPVTARARVAPPGPPASDAPPPPHAPEPGRAGGPAATRGTVYGAGAGYQEHPFDQDRPNEYPGHDGYPDPAAQQPPPEPGGTYRAGTYRSGGHGGGTYHSGGYPADQSGGYPADGYDAGHHQATGGYYDPGHYRAGGHPDEAYQAGGYPPGTYQSRHDDVPDYYYDDPDYSYEFRDRGY